jgi:hypothetical protein
MNSSLFWEPKVNGRFGETFRPHLHGQRIFNQEISIKQLTNSFFDYEHGLDGNTGGGVIRRPPDRQTVQVGR